MVDRRLIGAPLLALLACGPAPELPPGSPGLVRAAAEVFERRCATCHGERGRGDGPAGRGLFPGPRDFTDADWQARTDDARLRAVIVDGGASVGLSTHMLANPDLADSPALVGELVAKIRGFSRGQVPSVSSSRRP